MLWVMIRSRPRVLLAAVSAAAFAAGCTSTGGDSSGGSTNPDRPIASLRSFPSQLTALPTAPVLSGTAPLNGGSTAPPTNSGSPSGSVSGGLSASPTGTTYPIPAQPLRTVTAHSAHGDYVIEIWAEIKTSSCADHADAQAVIDFLSTNPCTGLDRVLATTTVAGRPVGFAESSLAFSGKFPDVYRVATRFQSLIRRHGTSSLIDLFREGYRLPIGPTAVPNRRVSAVLVQDAGVCLFDVWYLDGPTRRHDRALNHMAQDVFLQF